MLLWPNRPDTWTQLLWGSCGESYINLPFPDRGPVHNLPVPEQNNRNNNMKVSTILFGGPSGDLRLCLPHRPLQRVRLHRPTGIFRMYSPRPKNSSILIRWLVVIPSLLSTFTITSKGDHNTNWVSGTHRVPFSTRSWIWSSRPGDKCCIAFCRGSTVSPFRFTLCIPKAHTS
jgi:hypothetical protein